MGDLSQKIPLSTSLMRFVQDQIATQLQQQGQRLPCSVVSVSNAMVTVKFELISNITFPLVTVPQAISRYARPPTQIGDKGYLQTADAYLGGMTGLGGGVATYGEQMPNLSTLVFVPLSNTAFPTVDPNAYHITGPSGAVIQDDSAASVFTLTPSSITIANGSSSIVVTSSEITLQVGTMALVINSSGISVAGRDFISHKHSGVQTGSGDTGSVV